MATENECKGLRVLDPVTGLVDYILDVKPFHTKIVEVLVEYVYEEFVEITMLEDFHLNVEILSSTQDISMACRGGFGYIPYGGVKAHPVISPNQSIAFEDYPAIDSASNEITTPDDKTIDLQPGDIFELVSFVDDMEGLCQIVDIGSDYFIIREDSVYNLPFLTVFSGYSGPLQTSGMPLDDGKDFTISAILPNNPSAGFIRIEVNQLIRNPVPIGHFGLKRTPGNHTGTFTVDTIRYSEGSIDSWSDINVPSTYRVGDDPHTIIKTVEDLDPIPSYGNTETYVVTMHLPPILLNNVLSHSKLPDNPDEGYIMLDIIAATPSTLDSFGAAVPNTGSITVPGNLHESNIFPDEWVRIFNSTDNNGLFTIYSMSYDLGNDETTLVLTERIRTNVADGRARIDVPSNMFFVDGDHSHRFLQGTRFNIAGGSFDGTYMTLYSDFINGKTRIRPAENIIERRTGYEIIDIPLDDVVVISRDKTGTYTAGEQINIVGSHTNDGAYDIVSSTYDSNLDVTLITISGTLDIDINGFVHHVQMGYLKEGFYGYSNDTIFCAMTPEILVRVNFEEKLKIDGIHLHLRNDMILHNMENTDNWGYEIPITTHLSLTAPVIPEQVSAPGSPDYNDFWFNTDVGKLYYWSTSGLWIETKTVYWMEADYSDISLGSKLFYYRTMYDKQLSTTVGDTERVDTGWVQMFAHPPGFNDVQPASPPMFNAHVGLFSPDPHKKYHNNVYTNGAHFDNSYTFPGGNFVQRMGPELRLEIYDFDGPGFIEYDYPRSFEIESVNLGGNTFTIDGVFDWFYEADVVLGVRVWNDVYREMVIQGVSTGGGKTTIEVSPADIAHFTGLTNKYGLLHGAVYDPRSNFLFPNDQVKTHVIPNSGTDLTADGVIYNYVEPQRIHTLSTDAAIKEDFKIDWGTSYNWKIVDTSAGGTNVTINGDIISFLNTTDKIFISNSEGNDGEYEVTGRFLLGGPPIQTVVSLSPSLPADPLQGLNGYLHIEDAEVIDWFQFIVVSANSTTNQFVVTGDATNDIANGGSFRVIGTSNDGTYTATSVPTYSGGSDQTTIQVANIASNDSGGWIEHV